MIRSLGSIFLLGIALCAGCQPQQEKRSTPGIRGWNILTNIPREGIDIIQAAKEYDVNHLQLSHDIIMDLKDARDTSRARLANELADLAHQQGIPEVLVWDHALYRLSYYPGQFKTGPDSLLNLDDPAFWEWFKEDYRKLMALLPNIDGLVLTFIETGARAESQFSTGLKTPAEKLAKVVNSVAEVIIGELGKKMIIRTFAYNASEYKNIADCIELVTYDEVMLMMKETPHDFFLTHPNNPLPGAFNRPTLIEFDLGNEFNGQGIIANTYPEYVLDRWKELSSRENVVGYVARMDRFKTTKIIDKPSEVLAQALYLAGQGEEDPGEVYDSFITREYGEKALPHIKAAFQSSFEIITSSLYTLGLNTANHSELNFDYRSIYTRHVSGRWIDPPEIFVGHDVDKQFHYWKDVVNHLAPARHKAPTNMNQLEIKQVLDSGWIQPVELMNMEYLEDIILEKDYSVRQAREALDRVEKAEKWVLPAKYAPLYDTFYRTWVVCRGRRGMAKAYYGYRIYARGEEFQSPELHRLIEEGMREAEEVATWIEDRHGTFPEGQWRLEKDASSIRYYINKMTLEGWEAYGGVKFDRDRYE